MTDDQAITEAALDGFELVERTCGDQWVHGWSRGGDKRWSCCLERRQALDWMQGRLSRGRAFAWPGILRTADSPRTKLLLGARFLAVEDLDEAGEFQDLVDVVLLAGGSKGMARGA
jgi:hypothetical protein